MVKWIILGILFLPIAEIATFVLVGTLIGFGWALLLAIATSFAGFLVLRHAGRGRLARMRDAVGTRDTAGLAAHTEGFIAVLGGILLLLPGFLTDLAGALLLIGPIRRWFASSVRSSVTVSGHGGDRRRTVIDLDPNQWKQVGDPESPPRETDRLDRR